MYRPIVDSYFSGAGGLDWGMMEADCIIRQSLEYDRHCCETLKANFDHDVICEDIRERLVLGKSEKPDAIALTFPCTKYSAIADIHGTRTGDDLFLHAFRHVVLQEPEAFVVENVPGMKKFKVVMECFTKIPNYYVNVFCPLDASNWLPQKRKRLILIATRKHFRIDAPAPSVYRTKLKDIIEKDARVHIPDYVLSRIQGKYRDRPIVSDPSNTHELAPTCVAHYHKDLSTRLIKDASFPHGVRPYTVREYARLQGFPDSFQFAGGDREAYKQIGNAVAVPVGRWIGQQLKRYFNG
jgi:DNA (cytosine-5)-methyltransferase 1